MGAFHSVEDFEPAGKPAPQPPRSKPQLRTFVPSRSGHHSPDERVILTGQSPPPPPTPGWFGSS